MQSTLHISDILRTALRAEHSGNYRSGLESLRPFWDFERPGEPPDTAVLSTHDAARILLRAGALYGHFGISKRGYQERSKDILTRAFDLFGQAGDSFGQRMAATYLAVSYKRLGDSSNAETWLQFCFDGDVDQAYFHALSIQSGYLLNDRRFEAGLERLSQFESLFDSVEDPLVRAALHSNLAVFQRENGLTDAALRNFVIAAEILHTIENRVFQVAVTNNIALLYHSMNRLGEAMEHARRALALAEKTRENRQVGSVLDTHSFIVFEHGHFAMAHYYAAKAVEALDSTEALPELIEALESRMKAEVRLGRIEEALDTFGRVTLICSANDLTDLLTRVKGTLTRTLGDIRETRVLRPYRQTCFTDEAREFELIAAPALGLSDKIRVVELTNNELVGHGLSAGDLAIVEYGGMIAEDLVAVRSKRDGTVSLGLYYPDSTDENCFFLQGFGPGFHRRFDLRDFDVLGRIVARARIRSSHQRQIYVESLEDVYERKER